MAFLQICRRQQAVFEGVTHSLQRLVGRRRFYSSCSLHRCVRNQSVCLAKCTFSFLRPGLSNELPSLFSTQTFPLRKNVVDLVVEDESSAKEGKSTQGHETKNKTKKNSKKKKDKMNTKTGEAVKDTNLNEVDNTASKQQDSAASKKKKEKKSKSAANNKTKKGKNSSKAVEAKKDRNAIKDQENIVHNIEKKQSSTTKYAITDAEIQTQQLTAHANDRNISKDLGRQEHLDDTLSKAAGTLPAIESPDNVEAHPLYFSPDAVLIEAEEDLQKDSKLKHTHMSDLADVEVESVEDPAFQSKVESHIEIESGQHFKDRSYKDGTPGGRLFKEETLAEIDAYLYLGKPNEAERLFNRYLRKGKQFEVGAFNKLLHGWAQKGNLMSVKLVFNLLKHEGLEPDMGTYAALLHGYGKYKDVDGVQNIINEMKEKQFDVNHIFHKCCLTEMQAKGVANALKLVYPHYKPRITSESQTEISYPSLLKSWYSNRENTDIKLKSVPGKLEREFDESRLLELFEEQISRELSGFTPILSIEESKEEDTENTRVKEMFLECRSKWKEALIKSFEKDMFKTKSAQGDTLHPKYASLFQIFKHDELADIVLDTIVFYVKGRIEGVPLYGISGELGSVLNLKYIVKHRVQSGMLDKMKAIYQDYFSYLMDEKVMATKMAREFWNELDDMLPLGASLQQDVPNWPWATKVVFGCLLVECFLKSAHINVNLFNDGPEKILPAFYHTYEFNNDKRFGILKPHPIVCKLFKGYLAKQGEISMETTSVPMLVPPRPWRATKDGAYLILPVELIRSAGDEDGQYDKLLEKKTNKEDLVAIFDSLNFLGGCAWRTNKRILDIAVHVFNNGGNEDLAIPGPVVQPEVDSLSLKSADAEEKNKLIRERRLAKKLAREHYSLRMTALYKLSVANHFRDHVFWLPINLDFRGRVYPIPPHCAHVGDDLNRGMLQFAKGVPLGEKGLDWLKIHLVTLHGAKKKSSLQERLNYADEIMDDVLDSADNPLTGRGWWKTSDEPWQTLATSMEIADAVRSPDPTQFVSHQPVHQDGSCNGLQHYAALGHDSYGAKQVNLMPADRPQDVYEEVAKLVETARVRDAAAGHEIAKELEGKVTRKVVKQTVMTIVYGVTFIGGRLQIERQLKDLDVEGDVLFKGSYYLVNKVFASIGEMFTAARGIQNWFASSATQIALSGHYVDWYTPLGLYVRQPYCKKPVRHVIRTNLQWLLLQATGLPDIPPDTRKQRGAFPPNFIHSLDSTHMMLTAMFCQRSGSTFASVHDSFWTHAANVDVMNRICREQFVALHSEPILEELHKHFHQNYSGLKLNRPLKSKETGEERTRVSFEGRPEHGDFDIKEVLNSTYFFC